MLLRTRITSPRLALLALIVVFLGACSDGKDNPDAVPIQGATYDAFVRWTEYGIPHIKANDYGSLGYGFGYAYARENFCTVMREYVLAAGDSARYWGDAGDLNSDLVMKLYNRDERVQAMIDEKLEEYTVETLRGYVAGINRYLRE
ncbi:MAG: peptidase S45, partial [Halioglobus sp.]|nr:peptidase S45 [Halioglobus sp.]